MSIDYVIRNATLVDGTGAPPRIGDLAIEGDKIAAVGVFDGTADREIDGTGLTLTPGFIDIHTHFDPQLCWDRLATPSLEHGVTTVVFGNCSISVAPLRPEDAEKTIKLFRFIEDIELETLAKGVPFCWESFDEYLDYIRPGLGVNVAPLLAHSMLRSYVIGPEAQGRASTDAELARMCELVKEAVAAGAIGMSTSHIDVDHEQRPVSARYADMREKLALCETLMEAGAGVWATVPDLLHPEQEVEDVRELAEISRATGILCSFQPVPRGSRLLSVLEEEQARGARIYGQTSPRDGAGFVRFTEQTAQLFEMDTWWESMELPLDQRRKSFFDPSRRAALVAEMKNPPGVMNRRLHSLIVGDVKSEKNRPYSGRCVSEIAESEGKEIGEVYLDLLEADDLETEFCSPSAYDTAAEEIAAVTDHPFCHIGASDSGAHLVQSASVGDTTTVLQRLVREKGLMSLERAVYRLTGELATDWGIPDRGTLEVGKVADLVLFDLDKIANKKAEFVNDLPAGASRYVRRSEGYSAVFVGGQIAIQDGEYTEARNGRII